MDSEAYITEYPIISYETAQRMCNNHCTDFKEYKIDFPDDLIGGWITTEKFFGWLGY